MLLRKILNFYLFCVGGELKMELKGNLRRVCIFTRAPYAIGAILVPGIVEGATILVRTSIVRAIVGVPRWRLWWSLYWRRDAAGLWRKAFRTATEFSSLNLYRRKASDVRVILAAANGATVNERDYVFRLDNLRLSCTHRLTLLVWSAFSVCCFGCSHCSCSSITASQKEASGS